MHELSDSYVSAVVCGRIEPGPKLLAALGMIRNEATYSIDEDA